MADKNKNIREQMLVKCYSFLKEYFNDSSVHIVDKAEVAKKLFKLSPEITKIQIVIDKKPGIILDIKYKRGDYPEVRVWRKEVFSRDNFKCQKCGSNKRLEAHHIKSWKNFPKERFDINNGKTLCHNCHSKTVSFGNKYNAIC